MPEYVSRLDSTLRRISGHRHSIEDGKIDPSFLIAHRVGIEEAPDMYKVWRDKKDQVTKIVIDPWRDQIGDRIAA